MLIVFFIKRCEFQYHLHEDLNFCGSLLICLRTKIYLQFQINFYISNRSLPVDLMYLQFDFFLLFIWSLTCFSYSLITSHIITKVLLIYNMHVNSSVKIEPVKNEKQFCANVGKTFSLISFASVDE